LAEQDKELRLINKLPANIKTVALKQKFKPTTEWPKNKAYSTRVGYEKNIKIVSPKVDKTKI